MLVYRCATEEVVFPLIPAKRQGYGPIWPITQSAQHIITFGSLEMPFPDPKLETPIDQGPETIPGIQKSHQTSDVSLYSTKKTSRSRWSRSAAMCALDSASTGRRTTQHTLQSVCYYSVANPYLQAVSYLIPRSVSPFYGLLVCSRGDDAARAQFCRDWEGSWYSTRTPKFFDSQTATCNVTEVVLESSAVVLPQIGTPTAISLWQLILWHLQPARCHSLACISSQKLRNARPDLWSADPEHAPNMTRVVLEIEAPARLQLWITQISTGNSLAIHSPS